MAKLNWSGSCRKANGSRSAGGGAGVWNGRGDILRMRPFDRLVMVAVDDENGRVDRLQLIIGPVRLVRPHLADLVDEGVVFLRRRGMLGIFMSGPVDISGERRVFLNALDHAGGDCVGSEGAHLA